MTKPCLTIFFLLYYGDLKAQETSRLFSYGPFFEYVVSVRPHGSGLIGEKFAISSAHGTDGLRVGIFGQVRMPHGFWRSEMNYFKGSSSLLFVNLRPGEDMSKYGHADVESLSGNTHKLIELSVARGINLVGRLSWMVGLSAGVQFIEQQPMNPVSDRPMLMAMHSLDNNRRRVAGFASTNLNYEFGPVNVYIQWKTALSSLTNGIEYEKNLYPFNYRVTAWSIGINFFPFFEDDRGIQK